MLKFIGTEKEIKGVALVNANQTVDMGFALDQAFYTEGEVYVYHPELATAEDKAKHLNFELGMELGDIIEAIKEGGLTVSKLLDEGYADDVVAHIESCLKAEKAPKEEVSQEEILASLKEVGLEMGMVITAAGVSHTIKRFEATNEGVFATLDVAGKEHRMHVVKVLELKNAPVVAKGENTMNKKKVNFAQVAQNQTEEVMEMTNVNQVEEVVVEETKEEKIAKGAAAQKLLEQAKQKAAAQAAAKLAAQKQKEEETKMEQGTQTRKGVTPGRMGAGNTGTKEGTRPSRVLGAIPTQTEQGPISEELASKIYDGAPVVESTMMEYKGKPWFFNKTKYSNVLWDEILETRANPALGITDITILNPKQAVRFPKDEIAYVGVTIANSIKLQFKFTWNKKEEAKWPIDTQNIQWREVWEYNEGLGKRVAELKPVFAFWRSNARQYKVICGCGKWNDIKEIGKAQSCKCGENVLVKEEVSYAGEKLVNSNVVLQYLPDGSTVNVEVLAQVLAYAYMRLVPLMEEKGHQIHAW